MRKHTGKISYILLALMLFINISGYMHTLFHIQLCPDVFTIAQHRQTTELQIAADDAPSDIENCPVCDFFAAHQFYSAHEIAGIRNFEHARTASDSISFFSINGIFHSRLRAPPCA